MTSRRKDLISAAALLLAAVLVHLQARGITSRFKTGVDSGFLPEIVTAVLAVLALAIGLRAVLSTPRELPRATGQGRVLAVLGVMLVTVLVMPSVGFLPVATVMLFAQMVLLTPRGQHQLALKAVIAVVMAVGIWLVFTRGFGLILPSGPF